MVKNKFHLQTLWRSQVERQNVQLVLTEALANSTDLTAKNINLVFEQLDVLLAEKESEVPLKDRAI